MLPPLLDLGSRALGGGVRLSLRRMLRRPSVVGWSFAEELHASLIREVSRGTVRHGFDWARRVSSSLPFPPNVQRKVRFERCEVAGVPASWCRLKGAGRSDRCLLYYHGGGYAIGSAHAWREIIARLAVETGVPVLAPDYRLAPEHRFPTAHDDCFEAYRHVLGERRPEGIALAGDSAGGALALATLLRARDEGLPLPAGALLISPWVEPGATSESSESMRRYDGVDTIDESFLRLCAAAYLGSGAALGHPWASPASADLHGLPPLFVQVGELEVLRDQIERCVERAQEAGGQVTLRRYEGLFHAFQLLATALPRAQRAVAEGSSFLRRVLEQRAR